MLRRTLNKIFSSRVFYIIFALLASVVLWFYVEITENEEQTHVVSDIPIVWRNEDLMRDRGFLIVNHYPQTIDLTFEVPLALVSQLNNSTISVAVDLAGITRTGHVSPLYEIIYPPGLNLNAIGTPRRSIDRITLLIDQLSVRTVEVRGEYRGGTAEEDLVADAAEFDPPIISIFGPEDIISRIHQAYVPILRENLDSTYIDELGFMLLDEHGYELDPNLLELVSTNVETIHTTIRIRQVKSVRLDVGLIHGAGSTTQNTIMSIEPEYITVSGEPEALRNFNILHIGNFDMSSFTRVATDVFSIVPPAHITLESSETTAIFGVEVIGLDFVDFNVESIFMINVPPEHHVELVSPSIPIRIRGNSDDLEQITAMNIRAVVDLTDFTAGRHRPLARVYVDGTTANVGAIGEHRIPIIIHPD